VLRAKDSTPHPGLHLDVLQPIVHRWYPTQLVFDVLLETGTCFPSLLIIVVPKILSHTKMPSL
jgi:hypothetical protein